MAVNPIQIGRGTRFGYGQQMLADALAPQRDPTKPIEAQAQSDPHLARSQAMADVLGNPVEVTGGTWGEALADALAGGIRGRALMAEHAAQNKQQDAASQWQQTQQQRQQGQWNTEDKQQQAQSDYFNTLPADQQALARAFPDQFAAQAVRGHDSPLSEQERQQYGIPTGAIAVWRNGQLWVQQVNGSHNHPYDVSDDLEAY